MSKDGTFLVVKPVVVVAAVRTHLHSTYPTFQFFMIHRRSKRARGTSGLAEVDQGLSCSGLFNQFTKNTGCKDCNEQVTHDTSQVGSSSKNMEWKIWRQIGFIYQD